MKLVDRFVEAVTSLCAIFTFSPREDGTQRPISLPSRITPQPDVLQGPNFRPPGVPGYSSFACDYTAMVGWEMCSEPWDRGCWLRNRQTNKQYDIFTNYEDDIPTGTTRIYNLTLEDSWVAADGKNFTAAKLFKNDTAKTDKTTKYPGPWIQACWGDTYVYVYISGCHT